MNASDAARNRAEERTASHLIGIQGSDGELDYHPIPLEFVRTVNVRYEYVGELKPMPYDWDESVMASRIGSSVAPQRS